MQPVLLFWVSCCSNRLPAQQSHQFFNRPNVVTNSSFHGWSDTYRLIVKIEYRWQTIFVKHLLTHAEYDRGGWKTMNAEAIDYGTLLEETKPEVIHGEPENRRLIEILERLTAQEHVTEAEEKLIALLTVLVENFENQNYPVLDVGPLDIIRHLMEEHSLRQKDLADVFGTESIVSDVLNGKRELNKEHIRRLSERFKVSPAVFF